MLRTSILLRIYFPGTKLSLYICKYCCTTVTCEVLIQLLIVENNFQSLFKFWNFSCWIGVKQGEHTPHSKPEYQSMQSVEDYRNYVQ